MRLRYLFVASVAWASAPALAYIGPGSGSGVIATVIGVLSAFVLAVIGVVYYPVKRFFKTRKARISDRSDGPSDKSAN